MDWLLSCVSCAEGVKVEIIAKGVGWGGGGGRGGHAPDPLEISSFFHQQFQALSFDCCLCV